jgi:hypothetical protein
MMRITANNSVSEGHVVLTFRGEIVWVGTLVEMVNQNVMFDNSLVNPKDYEALQLKIPEGKL